MTITIPSFKSLINSKSDFFGAMASSLCMLHCLITPVLFAAQATSLNCSNIGPSWWKAIDYVFLVIALLAIVYTAKSTVSKWISSALYTTWATMTFLILNESFHLVNIPHTIIYIPAIILISLHIYNRWYCRCQGVHCCMP